MDNGGLTITVTDASGQMTDGVSYPRNLALLAHQAGTCTGECSYCYDEACGDLLTFQADGEPVYYTEDQRDRDKGRL